MQNFAAIVYHIMNMVACWLSVKWYSLKTSGLGVRLRRTGSLWPPAGWDVYNVLQKHRIPLKWLDLPELWMIHACILPVSFFYSKLIFSHSKFAESKLIICLKSFKENQNLKRLPACIEPPCCGVPDERGERHADRKHCLTEDTVVLQMSSTWHSHPFIRMWLDYRNKSKEIKHIVFQQKPSSIKIYFD